MPAELTEANFDETTVSGDVIVDFWASWCGPCVAFAPVFAAAADAHPNVVFAKVDTEAAPALAARFEVRSIPTLVFLRNGEVVGRAVGALGAQALAERIESTFT